MVKSYLTLLCVHAGRLISFSACILFIVLSLTVQIPIGLFSVASK